MSFTISTTIVMLAIVLTAGQDDIILNDNQYLDEVSQRCSEVSFESDFNLVRNITNVLADVVADTPRTTTAVGFSRYDGDYFHIIAYARCMNLGTGACFDCLNTAYSKLDIQCADKAWGVCRLVGCRLSFRTGIDEANEVDEIDLFFD